MKIVITIGRNPNNRIVIQDASNRVSGDHGELKISDNGSIIYQDFSTNGTMVNGKMVHNAECAVQRGAQIVFPNNVALNWNQVPQPSLLKNVKQEITFGTNPDNHVRLHTDKASRYHAALYITKDCKYYLYDQSLNGTMVNGVKIPKYQDYPIKRKDKVFFDSEPLNWSQIPKQKCEKTIYYILPISLLLVGVCVFLLMYPPQSKDICEEYNESVVELYMKCIYKFKMDNDVFYFNYAINENDKVQITYLTQQYDSAERHAKNLLGTGFFIDKQGHIATNRHVAHPLSSDIEEACRIYAKELFRDRADRIRKNSGVDIGQYYIHTQEGESNATALDRLANDMSNAKFDVEIFYFGYAVDGTVINQLSDFKKCEVIDYSKEEPIDLAIIQATDHKTPDIVKNPILSSTMSEGPLKNGEDVKTIGYNNGLSEGLNAIGELHPQCQSGHISQIPDGNKIQYDIATDHGSSGSPVFSNDGKLVAINYRLPTATSRGRSYGILVKHLKQLMQKNNIGD